MKYQLSRPAFDDTAIAGVVEVLNSGNLVQGSQVARFEAGLAEILGTDSAVAVSSGTAALHLALLAAEVGPGDIVLVPNFTFVATGNVVRVVGATPVFVDVGHTSYCMEPEALTAAYESCDDKGRVKAAIVVHEFGYPARSREMAKFAAQHDFVMIEDAACAIGAFDSDGKMAGTHGDFGCLSFHPRKTVTTGEGGAIIASNRDKLRLVRMLRDHGIDRESTPINFATCGLNYRLTDFQAALGVPQLTTLNAAITTRRELKDVYFRCLGNHPLVSLPANVPGHSWQTFMICLDATIDRDALVKDLGAKGIQTGPGAQALLALDSFSDFASHYDTTQWASTRLYTHGLALPFCELYSVADLEWISEQIIESLGAP